MLLACTLALVAALHTGPAPLCVRPTAAPRVAGLVMKTKGSTAGPEFVRVVQVTREKRVRIELRATELECAALARRFGWESLAMLASNATLTRVDARDRTRVSGKMTATLTRLSLDGATRTLSLVEEPYESYFIPLDRTADGPIDLDSEEAYDEEMGEGNTIDLGECLAQELYFYVDELVLDELGEYVSDVLMPDGEVVFDTDPDSD